MKHDIVSCGYVEKIKRQDLAMKDQVAIMEDKLGLVLMDRDNDEEQARLRLMNQQGRMKL